MATAHDYIGDTFLNLTQQNRVKDAKEFCERVIAEAPGIEFRCMARLNLAQLYFHSIGDGVGVREVCMAALSELDENPNIIEQSKKVSSKGMKELYCELCAFMRDVAITFEEYKEYQTKKWKYRSSQEERTRTEHVEKTYQKEGVPWIENIMSHAGDYWQHEAFSQSAVYLSLALEYKRDLRISREDLNTHVLRFYPNAVANVISYNTNSCLNRKQEVRLDNYEFIATKAISRIKDCENSRIADLTVVENSVKVLNDFLSEIRNNRKIEKARGYKGIIPHPTNEEIGTAFPNQMEILKNAYLHIDETDSFSKTFGNPSPQMPQKKIPMGCMVFMMIVLLGVAGYYWYSALITKSHGALSWALAIVCTLLFLNSIVVVIMKRNK